MSINKIPVVTIDGPSGTGKGTIARRLADALAWHLLDSGAIYRAIGWAVLEEALDYRDTQALLALLAGAVIELRSQPATTRVQVFYQGSEITDVIRSERVGTMASKVSALPCVREAVLEYQRAFKVTPGLIADGRDMGTVVFPDADLKLFLEASVGVRVQRRYQQLIKAKQAVTREQVKQELVDRDERDRLRTIAPLCPAVDAEQIDTSDLTIEQVYMKAMAFVRQRVL